VKELTKKQRDTLRAIKLLTIPQGPKVSVLHKVLGWKYRNSVVETLQALVCKGLVVWPGDRIANPELTTKGEEAIRSAK
jgi:Mn-dependent DtxR family transcriptional regulator